MARMSKIEQARWDGFNRACRVAREQGVDDIQRRLIQAQNGGR